MREFLQGLDTPGFMPHGMCYLWEPDLLWLHVVSDGLIWLAYWAIPPALVYLAWMARSVVPENAPYTSQPLPHAWVFWAFGLFIVACGTTHFMAVWTVWDPAYWVSGGVKVVTAMASVATAVALPPLVPRALRLVKNARESELRRAELENAHRELEAVHQRLKEYDRLKTQFFSNVSHELRTPLTLILGPVEELLEEEDWDPVRLRKLATVRANGRLLLGRVNDLLDVSQIEAGAVSIEPRAVDAAELVRRLCTHFDELARSRDVELVVEVPSARPAVLDPKKVERVLLNLLSNAFKVTPKGGTVRVQLREEEQGGLEGGGERLRFEVADSGPGVPEEERHMIFERFQRGGREGALEGTGLGLAIVAEFVRAMDGVVSVGVAPEGGALFTVVLPAQPAGDFDTRIDDGSLPSVSHYVEAEVARTSTSPGSAEEASAGPLGEEDADTTILLVEDNRELCEYLVDVLGSEHRIYVAHDGRSGLEAAARVEPDLILTDVMMPGMSGEEMIEALRAQPEHEHTPILVLTARNAPALPARLLEKGAQDYLVKPVRVDELRARARNLLELTRTRRILEREVGSEAGGLEELAAELAGSRRRLEETVDQKDRLLRELHHRVKGNLQTILSLLSLEIREVESDEEERVLGRFRGRVGAMAAAHESLYGPGDSLVLDLKPYLERLVDTGMRSSGVEPGRVSIRVRCPEMRLGIDQGVPLGLFFHELLTHCLERASSEGGGGEVEVSCVLNPKEGGLTVGVSHDGERPPEKPGALELAEALARQLNGELEVEAGRVTRFSVSFPVREQP